MYGRRRRQRKQKVPGGQKQMLEQLSQLQTQMLEAQEQLAEQTVTVSVGGGVVTVVMTGHQKLESVTIQPEVLDPDDVEMLQDLIIAAVNEAVEKSQELAAQTMGSFTGPLGVNLEGLIQP